jgi:hypothetical protein
LSPITVSRALREPRKVSPPARARVVAAVAEPIVDVGFEIVVREST